MDVGKYVDQYGTATERMLMDELRSARIELETATRPQLVWARIDPMTRAIEVTYNGLVAEKDLWWPVRVVE
jgi:hypothetical protein